MIDFPASPTVGQLATLTNGVTYRWDGTIWVATGQSAGGDFYATLQYPGMAANITFTTMTPPVITGNSGGYYSVANGRFTPPAGRYFLHADITGYTSVATTNYLGVQIRKNGVVIQDNYDGTGSSWYAQASIDVILDANGSDWFDAQVNCASALSVCEGVTFLAYPISGIKGPQGDPPTAGGGIIREVIVTTPTNFIDLPSLGVKSVEVMWHLIATTASTTGRLRFSAAGVVNSAASYFTIRHFANNGTPGADTLSGQVGFLIIGANAASATVIGRATFPSLTSGSGISQWWHNTVAATILMNAGLTGPSGGDGLYFSCDTGNFAAGSFVRVIGWP